MQYFFTFGVMFLIIMTIKDYINNKNVDTRYNYIMYGVVLSILANMNISYILVKLLLIAIFVFWITKLNIFGGADIMAFQWIFTGLIYINPYLLGFFLCCMAITTALYYGLKNYIFKIPDPVQYMGVILINFILTAALYMIK
jgi:hypothetical protein